PWRCRTSRTWPRALRGPRSRSRRRPPCSWCRLEWSWRNVTLPTTMPKNRGADALAATLAAHGVRRVFTLSGNHVMSVFDAALDAGIELVHVRHEGAAVHMADSWARITGEVGVA